MLPHQFPFRLIDRVEGDSAVLAATVSAQWLRDSGAVPAVLSIEILAQAAIVLFPDDGKGGRALLAGVDAAQLVRPLAAGERLQARVRLVGHFGRMMKIEGELTTDGGELLARAGLLLARED